MAVSGACAPSMDNVRSLSLSVTRRGGDPMSSIWERLAIWFESQSSEMSSSTMLSSKGVELNLRLIARKSKWITSVTDCGIFRTFPPSNNVVFSSILSRNAASTLSGFFWANARYSSYNIGGRMSA